ncbi:MAG: adenosylcobinamide-GDP ribazoletransferase [Bacillota bacterium]|nr:adenosylcobinamide-GDP ribazoletransferase [Bacillota bacterium]
MSSFLLMLSFFTRIPVGNHVEYSNERFNKGIILFPLTGFVVGIFLVVPKFLNISIKPIEAIVIIILYLMITGAIHIDGLTDSLDGLLSNRDQKRILEIMKDSRIGTFGAIGLILYFLILYTTVQIVDYRWLFLMPFVGKVNGFLAAGVSKYARGEGGMGKLFIEGIGIWNALIYSLIMVVLSYLILGTLGLMASLMVLMFTIAMAKWTYNKIGGMTGDTIGLVIEVSQCIFLLIGSMRG